MNTGTTGYPMRGAAWRTALGLTLVAVAAVAPTAARATLPSLTTGETAVATSNCQEAQVTMQVNGVGDPVTQRLPIDLMILFDRSASMDDAGGNPVQPITDAKNGAKTLVNQLNGATDLAGLTTISTTATLAQPLTNVLANVSSAIDAITVTGNTNIGGGVLTGQTEIAAHGRAAPTVHVMVLLSDGVANRTASGTSCPANPTSSNACTQDAINQAATAKAAGTVIFTIGLNLNNLATATATVARNELKAMASNASNYYEAPTSAQLAGIFSQIGTVITTLAGSNIVITDILATGVQYEAGSANPPPTTVAGQTLTWNLGLLNVNSSTSVTFLVTLNPATTNQLIAVTPTSRINYNDYQGNPASAPLPETRATVPFCPTATATRTSTTTPTATATNTSTATATGVFTSTATRTFTNTPTITNTPAATFTGTATSTPANTATATLTASATFTFTGTATRTPVNTPANTATGTASLTPTATLTATGTRTFTPTPADTATQTATPTRTDTPTSTPTPTPNLCGDGVVNSGEACDDGNNISGDGCEPDCTLSIACTYTHPGTPSEVFVGSCGSPSYFDIQSAINAVGPGDIVSVCPGTYVSPIQINEEITLRSTAGAATTIIHTSGTAIDIRRSGVTVEGFTIQSDAGAAITADSICPLGQASCGSPQHGSNLIIAANIISNSATGIAWHRKIDCAVIGDDQNNPPTVGNVMQGNGVHIDLDQQDGTPSNLVKVFNNSMSGGGTSGRLVHLAGFGPVLGGNTIQNSVTAGIEVGAIPTGAKVAISDSQIVDNAGDGITLRSGSVTTQIRQNNITGNGVGIGNEAPGGVVDATLNWWGSETGPYDALSNPGGLGDIVEERAGGFGTDFIEFLCDPAPRGFPSTNGICSVLDLQDLQYASVGRSPDVSSNGRFITFVSNLDQNGDVTVTANNLDGGGDVFLLNRKPGGKAKSYCLGGARPGHRCALQQDCPSDETHDPIILEGACILTTQISNGSATAQAFAPRATLPGDIFFTSTGNLTGANADGSTEVFQWSRRQYRKESPPDPNMVVTQISSATTNSEGAAPATSGRYVSMESTANPAGQNADGNREIFMFDTHKSRWWQVTNTVAPFDSQRPSTSTGRQVLFDSTADLVPGQNTDGNRELFLAVYKAGQWKISQLTHTTLPVENRAGNVASHGRLAVFSSNGDFTGGNPDGSREIFAIEKGVFTQLTNALPPRESVNPQANPYGKFVVFESTARLVPEDAGATNRRVFLFDRVAGTTLRLSRSLFGDNFTPRISKGRFVVWESTANLTGQNSTGQRVLYLYDRRTDN